MNILTKIKKDHTNIHALLQQIISKARQGNKINILLEDFFEEVKEHIQAEKACISEMLVEEQKQEKKSSLQIDKKILSRLLSETLCQNFDGICKYDELENKLSALEKLLQEHSDYIEGIILLLSQDCISDQKSEELSVKFEHEKIKTLISGITYA